MTTADLKPFQDLNKLYKSCMNTDLMELRGATPVLDVLTTMGGWPVVQGTNWNGRLWTWDGAVVSALQNGYATSFMIDFKIMPDLVDPTKRVLSVSFSFEFFLTFLRKKDFIYDFICFVDWSGQLENIQKILSQAPGWFHCDSLSQLPGGPRGSLRCWRSPRYAGNAGCVELWDCARSGE